MTVDSNGSALGQLLSEQQGLIGCPDWCQWAARYPKHEHSTTTGVELVLVERYSAADDEHHLEVLEAHHGPS